MTSKLKQAVCLFFPKCDDSDFLPMKEDPSDLLTINCHSCNYILEKEVCWEFSSKLLSLHYVLFELSVIIWRVNGETFYSQTKIKCLKSRHFVLCSCKTIVSDSHDLRLLVN